MAYDPLDTPVRKCTDSELNILNVLGYTICTDPFVPGHWMWSTPEDQSCMSFTSKEDAELSAWCNVTGSTIELLGITGDQWRKLDNTEQNKHILEQLTP